MLLGFFKVVYIINCFFLIMIVLIQSGKGGGMGGLFGGSGSQSLFGSTAGNVLTRITTVSAVIFLVGSLGIGYMASKGPSVVEQRLKAGQGINTVLPDQKRAPVGEKTNIPEMGTKAPESAPLTPVSPVPLP